MAGTKVNIYNVSIFNPQKTDMTPSFVIHSQILKSRYNLFNLGYYQPIEYNLVLIQIMKNWF